MKTRLTWRLCPTLGRWIGLFLCGVAGQPLAPRAQTAPPVQQTAVETTVVPPPAEPSAATSPAATPAAALPKADLQPVAVKPLSRAPRVGSIAAGYTYAPLAYLPLSENSEGHRYQVQGLRIDGKFGWQVGGFQSNYPSYVGFMSGFFYLFGGAVSDSVGIDYGLFAKHVITPGPKVRCFLAYGLGATQVWVRGLDGRGIGHVTRLSAGVDVALGPRLSAEIEFAYQFNILPNFAGPSGQPPATHDFHALALTAGLWFGRTVRP